MKRRLLIALAVLVPLLCAGALLLFKESNTTPSGPFGLAIVTAHVDPIDAPMSGKVLALAVAADDRVEEGDLLFTLAVTESAEMDRSHPRRMADPEILKLSQWVDARAERYELIKKMADLGAVPHSDVVLAKAHLETARSKWEQAKPVDDVVRLKWRRSDTLEVRARRDGVVVQVEVEEGQEVQAGDPILSMRAGSGLSVDAYFPPDLDLEPLEGAVLLQREDGFQLSAILVGPGIPYTPPPDALSEARPGVGAGTYVRLEISSDEGLSIGDVFEVKVSDEAPPQGEP